MSKEKNTNGQRIVYLKLADELWGKLKTEGAVYGMTGAQYIRFLCIMHFERQELHSHDS